MRAHRFARRSDRSMTASRDRLELDRDAALVLFEMLTRRRPDAVVRARDAAEQVALWELEAALERGLSEPLRGSYDELVAAARGRLRDRDETALASTPFVVFVDVDDTLVRSAGSKRIPMTSMVERVRELHAAGCELYCWSAGGAAYAEEVALELDVAHCFVGFLPKPHVFLDDQTPEAWRGVVCIHPGRAEAMSFAEIAAALRGEGEG